MASLHATLRNTFSETVDPYAVGREVTCRWSEGIDRALRARDAYGAADRFLDLQYADLVRDPIAAVRRVYDHFGMELSPVAEGRMRHYLVERPKDRHGVHHYSLAQFGFDRDEERERYRSYRQRFGF